MTTNRQRKNAKTNTTELGDDLQITKLERRTSCGGAWACGTIAGHRFSALVFLEHADSPDFELGDIHPSLESRMRSPFVDREIK